MKNNYVIVEGPQNVQGSSEWKQFRRGKVGASDAPSIMGVNPYETKLQAWERFAFDQEREATPNMQYGKDREEEARQWMNNQLKEYSYVPIVVQNRIHPDLIASLDGYYEGAHGTPHLLEIKWNSLKFHREAMDGKIPIPHYPQLQHQMDLVDVDQMLYLSCYGDDQQKWKIIPIHRSKDYCELLRKEELDFLASVREFIPPEPSDRDWVSESTGEALMKSDRYTQLSLLIGDLEKEKEQVRKEIIQSLLHSRTIYGKLKIQKILRKGTINYARMVEELKIDPEVYRNDSTNDWRIDLIREE